MDVDAKLPVSCLPLTHLPFSTAQLQESVLCIPTDRRLPKIRLRSRQLHRLLGQVRWGASQCYVWHLAPSCGPTLLCSALLDGPNPHI